MKENVLTDKKPPHELAEVFVHTAEAGSSFLTN